MLFFFKKKKLVVDCFTHDRAAYELYPLRKATPYYPETIKKMPGFVKTQDKETNVDINIATIKQCTGITGLYKHGAIIPFWTDYVCQPHKCIVEKRSRLGVAEGMAQQTLTEHPRIQYPGLFDDFVNVKFQGVWNLSEPNGTKFIVMPAVYNLNNLNNNFIIPPALSYYDIQSQTNLQMFIRKDSPDFTILAGTPILHLIPLIDSDRQVEYKTHLVDIEEWTRVGQAPHNFPQLGAGVRNARFRKLLKEKEEMDKMEKKSKCPFGFSK